MNFNLLLNVVLKYKYRNITYSQCGEDRIILHIFSSLKIDRPSYIDIGAYHPFHINNTAIFYLKGSRGINIEPNYDKYNLFKRLRARDINLNLGIAQKIGYLNYYEMDVPSLNTFSKKEAEKYVKEGYKIKKVSQLKVETVENILKEYWNGKFPDLLSLDVEGLEMKILKSINFNKSSPIVICAETISFSVSGQGKKNFELIKFIEDKGYLLYADTNINSIFVRRDIRVNG